MLRENFTNLRNTITLIALVIGLPLFILFTPEEREDIEMRGKNLVFNVKEGTGFEDKYRDQLEEHYAPQKYIDDLEKFSCKLDLYKGQKSNFTSSCNDKDLLPGCSSKSEDESCYGQLDYDDGYYIGEINDGEPNGLGEFLYADETKEIGFYTNGEVNGLSYSLDNQGRITFVGNMDNNQANDQGMQIFYDPFQLYIGNMKEGYRTGEGKYISEEYIYEGNFLNGYEHGTGEFINRYIIYKGYFRYGHFHGPNGEWENSEGSKYLGEFKHGASNGYGIMKYDNGDSYTGYWRHDLHHGKGEYLYSTGLKYTGNYSNGLLNDVAAVVSDKDMTCISGYKNDIEHGLSECSYKDGSFTKINYDNGVKHGDYYELTSDGVKIFQIYEYGITNGEYRTVYPNSVEVTYTNVDGIPMGKLHESKNGIITRSCDYDFGIEKNCTTK